MNVRFFGGTKEQYLSLPSPHNPLGLYFCADTKELFWGDKLLSDGVRLVQTQAELPECLEAADGILYYINETHTGFMLSQDRTTWLQVIYAPVTDIHSVDENDLYSTVATAGAVLDVETKIYKTLDERIANIEIDTSISGIKAISFAGIELNKTADGTFSIDRASARMALGINIPDGEHELATKDYVDNQIATIPQTDLSDYVKRTDLEGLATEEFVQTKIAEAELNNKEVDLTAYYTKTEVDSLIPDISNLASTEYVNERVASIVLPDTDNFALKSDIPDVSNFITNIPDEYITETELTTKGYVTETTVNEIVTTEINTVLADQIETKVQEVVQDKVNAGEITVATDAISYGDF